MFGAPWLLQYPAVMADYDCVCADEQRRLALVCVVDFAAIHILHFCGRSLKDVVECPKAVRKVFSKLRGYYVYVLEAELGKELLSSRRRRGEDDALSSQFVQCGQAERWRWPSRWWWAWRPSFRIRWA